MGNNTFYKEILDWERKRYKVEVINTWATGLAFVVALIAFMIAILK